jgi:YfiH family protein
VLTCDAFEGLAECAFTTRTLDVRSHDATPIDTWAQLARHMGVAVDRCVRMRQVHGTDILQLDRGLPLPSEPVPADVSITNRSDIALVVQSADCVPIVLADRRGRAVAVVHAGWRGTVANAAGRAVERLRDAFDVDPVDLVAAIGPSIGRCCYEVGVEVQGAFESQAFPDDAVRRWLGRDERGRLTLDLWQASADQLTTAGLHAQDVHVARLCTASNLDVFPSYRSEGERAGRFVGCVRLRPAVEAPAD